MSISRTADTITVKTRETGTNLPATLDVTALSEGRVTFGGTIFDRTAALELALALVATATGTTVHRPAGSPNYFVECGDEVQKLLPADWDIDTDDKTAAWVVFDLLRLLGKPATYAMAGESQESLAREFPYLTDDQAKAISNYFASLAS